MKNRPEVVEWCNKAENDFKAACDLHERNVVDKLSQSIMFKHLKSKKSLKVNQNLDLLKKDNKEEGMSTLH